MDPFVLPPPPSAAARLIQGRENSWKMKRRCWLFMSYCSCEDPNADCGWLMRSTSVCRSLHRPFLDGHRICRSLQPRLKHQRHHAGPTISWTAGSLLISTGYLYFTRMTWPLRTPGAEKAAAIDGPIGERVRACDISTILPTQLP